MTASRTSLDPQTLAKLSGLEVRAKTIVEGVLSGLHRSPARGFSAEFAEHREYSPGDDPRYLDWKVFARSDRHYLKQFEAETNFACYLLLDSSESMGYRSESAAVSKLEYAKWVAAALSHLVLRQRDAVGVATFDSELRQYLRPSGQPTHLLPIVKLLEETEAGEDTDLGPTFHAFADRLAHRGVVFILSDCFDEPETLLLGLRHLHHRRHDVRVLQIIDPAEQDFPFEELTLFQGLENLPEELADPKALGDAYRAEFEAARSALAREVRGLGMSYHLLRTDRPVDEQLRSVLRSQ